MVDEFDQVDRGLVHFPGIAKTEEVLDFRFCVD
jgi:hypothetical protein